MTRPCPVRLLAVTVAVIAAVPAVASPLPPPWIGSFEGSGRACYGRLAVEKASISWRTPLGTCRRTAYELIESDRQAVRAVFRLKRPGGSCQYRVIVMQHDPVAKADLGWQVSAYPNLADYRASRVGSALNCGMVRLD